jgi:hypothetical protein
MKKIFLYTAICFAFACSDSNQQKVNDAISKTSDSLVSKLDKANDTLKNTIDSVKSKIPKIKIETYKTVPISLQWIGFDKPGDARITKLENDWYTIKGEQTNSNNEYLKIDGKLKKLNENQVAFEGTIITFVKYNNDGKPCEKTGRQIFLKKGDRKYYRLQNMNNCEGGRLVDYVDIYNIEEIL